MLARHRFHRLCWEARLHTRAGRLPVVLWTRPTKVGERLFVWCRAGICADDFTANSGELAAACYAREARVTRNTAWSQIVTIDIIRRDTLAARHKVGTPLSRLMDTYAAYTRRRTRPARRHRPPRPGPVAAANRPQRPRLARAGRITPNGSVPGATPPGTCPAQEATMTATIPAPAAVPVFPLSIFAPVHIGIDEFGELVHVELAERNMLLGGEPGGGKSSAINLITAHGALSGDCRLILIDGKQVELGLWRDCADRFVGPSMTDALDTMRWLQGLMNGRYDQLVAAGLRKITAASGEPVYLVIIDEYAYFSATVGTKPNRDEFSALVRDLVARGRAAGVIVILATQRPSHQVIDPSLRDLFGYRWAFRCTTDSSSDTVLGHGWAGQGYTAATIDPLARGVSWLLAETGIPRRVKTAYLTDDHIKFLAAYAAQLRRKETPDAD